jgi:hypothetical protein
MSENNQLASGNALSLPQRADSGLHTLSDEACAQDRHNLFMQTLTSAQVDFLLQRTPKHEIKYRQGRGGLQFAYVEHGYVTERLNLVFGFNWDFEIVDKQILEDEVIVQARLTVRTPSGQTIVKTQFGGAEIKRHASGEKRGRPLSIADDYKAAASDALKKCASLLGIGLDLYGRDRPYDGDSDDRDSDGGGDGDVDGGGVVVENAKARAKAKARPNMLSGNARSGFEPVDAGRQNACTPDQLREIARLAAKARIAPYDLAASLRVGDLGELTHARAERVIARLRERVNRLQQAS